MPLAIIRACGCFTGAADTSHNEELELYDPLWNAFSNVRTMASWPIKSVEKSLADICVLKPDSVGGASDIDPTLRFGLSLRNVVGTVE